MPKAKKNSDVDTQPAKLSKPLTRRDTFFLMNPDQLENSGKGVIDPLVKMIPGFDCRPLTRSMSKNLAVNDVENQDRGDAVNKNEDPRKLKK